MQVKDLILEYLNQPYFKSAVAFFFLFFLHGTSIGNGQQGISYNGSGIAEGGALNHQS
jgi:hypothetical protein